MTSILRNLIRGAGITALMVAVVALATGAMTDRVAAEGFKIAYLSPLTGRLQSYGQTQHLVIDLAVEEINNKGGINGHPIELVVEDTAFNPKTAVEKVRKVAERDQVFLSFGPYGSGEMDVVAPLAAQLKLPMVSTVFTKIGVPAKNQPWVVRIGPNDEQVIDFGIAAYRKQFPNAKTVALIGNAGEPYVAATLKNYLPNAFKKHGFELVETVEVTTGQVDYAPAVNKLGRASADIVMIQAIAGELMGIAKEVSRQGLKDKSIIAGLQGTWAGPWIKIAGDAFNDTYAVASFDVNENRAKVQDLVTRFEKKRMEAGLKQALTVEPAGYDAMMMIAEAIRRSGVTPSTPVGEARQKIITALHGVKNHNGVTGTLSVTGSGETDGFVYRVVKGTGGNWVAID